MSAATAPRPVGRPARISRAMIAEAAHELGLDGLTLKAVADHLDVSIAALYHHVSGKDDLMRLAAELSAARVPLPQDRGQHWSEWLHQWATYNRDIFLSQPGLLAQYLEGMLAADVVTERVEAILAVLVRHGFSVLDANDAYELVTSCALGNAIAAIREQEAHRADRPLLQPSRDTPHVRALLADARTVGRRSFDEQIDTVLTGIAARQGLDWEPVSRPAGARRSGSRAERSPRRAT